MNKKSPFTQFPVSGYILISLLCFLQMIIACSPPTDKENILAKYKNGTVTEEQVRREVHFLHQSELKTRIRKKETVGKAWNDWIQRVALRTILFEEKGQTEGKLPIVIEQSRKSTRNWLLGKWRKDCYGLPMAEISEAEIATEAGEDRKLPPRIRLNHIFLKAETKQNIKTAKEKLNRWKSEISGIKQFETYAKKYSDSQTAKIGGRLGVIKPGWLPADVEKILYSLPENSISEPIEIRTGVHIFYIVRKFPAMIRKVDKKVRQLRSAAIEKGKSQCRRQKIDQLIEINGPVQGKGFEDLKAGAWFISGDLLKQVYYKGKKPPESIRKRYYENELLFQEFLKEYPPTAQQQARMQDLLEDALLNYYAMDMAQKSIEEPSEQEVREIYENEPNHYRSQIRMALTLIKTKIPKNEDPVLYQEMLTRLSEDLHSGKITWKNAVTKAGSNARLVKISEMDAVDVIDRITPLVFESIKNLPAGSVSDPIQDLSDFYIIGIDQSIPSHRLSFDEVKQRIQKRLITKKKRKQMTIIMKRILENSELHYTPLGKKLISDQEKLTEQWWEQFES